METIINLVILIGIGLILKTSTLIFVNRSIKTSKKLYYYQLAVGLMLIIGGNIILRGPMMGL